MTIGLRSLHIGPKLGIGIGGASDIAFQPTLLALKIGDSGCVGFGTGDSADLGFTVGTPNVSVKYNRRYAVAVGPPPTLIDYPAANTLGSLSLYSAPSGQSMGSEMSLGPALLTGTAKPCLIEYGITGSTLAVEWLPTGTYPAAGAGNLYHLMVAYVHAFESSVAHLLDIIIIELGTNDAANGGQTTAFAANMAAAIAQVRIDFPGVKIVLVRPNINVPNAGIATVAAAIDTIVAGDSTIKKVETDDLPLSGSFHATSNGYLSQGQREGYASFDALGVARPTVATVPDAILYGPTASGTANLTVIPPAGETDGDLEVMVVVSGKIAGTVAAAVDWTQVSNFSTTAAGEIHRMAVFTRPVTEALLAANNRHMPAATVIVVTANRNAAKIFAVRGPNLNPTVDVSQTTTPNVVTAAAGTLTITGVTTTANNGLVMIVTGGGCGGDGTMVVTAAGLTNVREVQDSLGNVLTDRELINLTIGTKAALGATGNFSMTPSNNTIALATVVAIKP